MTGEEAFRSGRCFRILAWVVSAAFLLSVLPGQAGAAPTAAIVMDARTGAVLFEENADARLHPASLTKMLTLYIAFDAIRRGEISLDTMVTVSAKAAAEPPSKLGLRPGQRISMRHLIRAAAIKSANDAATAIGEAISGSEAAFTARMDRTAKALGMSRSTFKNAHGLTAPGHLSTARDMNLLGRRLFYDFPEYYGLFSRLTEDAGVARVANTNRRFLESYRGADGIKTGYTRAAGFNLTASAERGNKRIIATVFGGTSTAQRNARMAELMEIGFGNAPARATVRRPAAVSLDEVASAPGAATQGNGDGRSAAKTIRLVTAVARSPRPVPRPEAATPEPDVLIALTADIATMVAELAQAAPDDPPRQTAAPEPRPEVAPVALVEAPVQPQGEATPEPAAIELPRLAAAAPPVRPQQAAPEPEQTAAVEIPFQVIDLAELPEDDALRMNLAEAGDDPETMPPEVRLAAALVVPALRDDSAGTRRPQPRPGQIVMTAAHFGEPAGPQPAAAAPEIVTRISTSGGRHWSITLGRFPSRGAAERILFQTALAEPRVLDGALRKVVQRGGGFDANFAGLGRDQADLACRRLQARAIQCFTLGP
ncbi:MAG: serine hydrolase [Gemmobacter sp.]